MQEAEQKKESTVRELYREDFCTVYQVSNETGEGRMSCYHVFDGCWLIYNDLHMERGAAEISPKGEGFFIEHCREGRIEWDCSEDRCVYVEPGDIQVNCAADGGRPRHYPLRHYHGMTIVFDVDEASPELLHVMNGVSVDLRRLKERLCPDNETFVLKSGPQIDRIFSDLYNLTKQASMPYFKLKVLELLLFLENLDVSKNLKERPYYHRSQVDKIKEMLRLLTGDLEHWYTLKELSERYDFPMTALKLCFKGIYGCTLAAYMRDHRMKTAAALLRDTKDSVISIAAKVGYDNPGKFSVAFRTVIGLSPTEYRRTVV